MRIFFLAIVGLAVFCTVGSVPLTNDDIDYGEEDVLNDQEDENMQQDTDTYYLDKDEAKEVPDANTKKNTNQNEPAAQILTPETVFVKDLQENVTLPCKTAGGDDGVIMWYKDEAIVYQASVSMGAKPNNELLPDNSLVIMNITESDAGQYKCLSMISKNNEASITHTLKVKVPPTLTELSVKGNQTVLSVGQELVLTCHATGYPEPVIAWHKEIIDEGGQVRNERLPLEGNILTVSNITTKDGGRYLCFADNHIGKPALQYINIDLTHKPIVSIEKYVVNSDKDMSTELKCTVKAKPEARVVWLREDSSLKNSERIELLNEGEDHILVMHGLQESDFGKYVCLAKNHLGTVQKSISLVKTPAVLEFIKPEKPTREMVLTWKVESMSPITGHQLQYRKMGDLDWQSVKPEIKPGNDGVYIIKYILKDLQEGTYETRCRSQNRHGWSNYSDIILVEGEKQHHGKHGKKPHKHHKEKSTTPPQDVALAQQPEKESEVGESKNPNASSSLSPSLLISCIALLYLYLSRP